MGKRPESLTVKVEEEEEGEEEEGGGGEEHFSYRER
jgi:hypothetical protein